MTGKSTKSDHAKDWQEGLMMIVDKWTVACKWLVALAIIFPGASNADSFFCEAERASGFVYDKETDTWEAKGFSIENRKYLVSSTNESDIFLRALKHDYEIKKIDSQKAIIHCKNVKYTDSNEETGLIACRGPFGASFSIDKRNGRYIRSQPTGYVTLKTNSDTGNGPYMEIGSCTPK